MYIVDMDAVAGNAYFALSYEVTTERKTKIKTGKNLNYHDLNGQAIFWDIQFICDKIRHNP